MLQIRNIRKQYRTGDFVQTALDDVSLDLRDNEFVAVLGPSGSGKTTLLNIIGGLDRYDSGDLIIDGISTKKYKDRDWDSYRNHSVGFVFQSYNLIPHQTVLKNVELALTIGGISKKQRKERALEALEKVGLGEQAHKKPNQMSGGQMQRVAIARALVNDPKILLADEPTGALDTKTSLQVMDLLKEVARDRLVVMVTHNPELAEKYATRTIRLTDGAVTSDTDPFEAKTDDAPVHRNMGRSSMSVLTSLGLSLNNLLTKKGRTILTAFAGSIGIIGIALILALSTGFQNYIDSIQEETMTSYPLSINSESSDVFSTILSMRSKTGEFDEEEKLVEQQYITSVMSSIASNDLKSFKKYLEENEEEYIRDIRLIKYSYSVSPMIYTVDAAGNLAQLNPNRGMSQYMDSGGASFLSSLQPGGMGTFQEISDIDMMKDSHVLLKGRWPEKYDELIAVVSEPNQISDLMVYGLGFRDTTELRKLIADVMAGNEVENEDEPMIISYDDILGRKLKLVDPSRRYSYNATYDIYEDMSEDRTFMEQVYRDSEDLKIVGIAYVPDSRSAMGSGVFYLPELTRHVIETSERSGIVKKQLADMDTDVFSGNRFDEEKNSTGIDFNDMITVDEELLKSAFSTNFSGKNLFDTDSMGSVVMAASEQVKTNLEGVTSGMVTAVSTADRQISSGMIDGYIQMFKVSLPDIAPAPAPVPAADDCQEGGDGDVGTGEEVPSGGQDGTDLDNKDSSQPDAGTEDSGSTGDNGMPAADTGTDTNAPETEGDPEGSGDENAEETPETPPVEGSGQEDAEDGNGTAGEEGKEGAEDVPVPATTDYVIIESAGMYMPDVYRSQAFTDEAFDTIVSKMGDLKLSSKNLKKIALDAYDIYFSEIKAGPGGMVKLADMPDPDEAVDRAIKKNESLIFEEAYGLAKDYTTILIAQGMGEALEKVMRPIASVFSGGRELISVDTDKFAEAFNFDMDEDELRRIMETMLSGSESSGQNNLLSLGYQDIDDPTRISFYFKDFETKGDFTEFLERYNSEADEERKLKYTDITGLLMGSVETIINAVTYVLIAFVSISLVVSSIMIGIITYISVLERTKEIGILRAIGASKRNIASIFNAETFIIGLLSGAIGVGVSWLAIIPINGLIHRLTDIEDLSAVLRPEAAAVLVAVAVVLTIIGGLIPSRSASRKDPVIALRTE